MNERLQLEISTWSIVKIVLILLLFYMLYFLRDVLILLFIVLILASTFRPVVNRWEKKIGRLPAVLLLVLMFIAIVAFVGYIMIPPFVKQIENLVISMPALMEKSNVLASYKPVIESGLKSFTSNIGSITGGFLSLTASIFGGIISVITAIVLTVYLLLDKDCFKKIIDSIVPIKSRDAIVVLAKKVSDKAGDWFRGQMFLSLVIGVVDFVGLYIIGLREYALMLAVISAILEIVPTLGPLIAGTIAALIALSYSPLHALLVIILYVAVQQLENTILVPKIMQKAVGLSPVVIIVAILTGAKLLGLFGALIAVPISAIISVIIQEWPSLSQALTKDE